LGPARQPGASRGDGSLRERLTRARHCVEVDSRWWPHGAVIFAAKLAFLSRARLPHGKSGVTREVGLRAGWADVLQFLSCRDRELWRYHHRDGRS
jgi:hypothetical protein